MKLVHEGSKYNYYADDDKRLVRYPLIVHLGVEIDEVEELDGECACAGCNANRDWEEYE